MTRSKSRATLQTNVRVKTDKGAVVKVGSGDAAPMLPTHTIFGTWFNSLMGTLKPQSNGPLYSNTAIGRLRWQLLGGLLHLAPPSPLLAVPNVTAHPSMASVPTSYHSMWYYNCICTLKVNYEGRPTIIPYSLVINKNDGAAPFPQ